MSCLSRAESRRGRLIVGISWCPYTQRAIATRFTTNVLLIDECADGDAIRAALRAETGQRTVPYVFDGDTFIGGYDELVQHLRRRSR